MQRPRFCACTPARLLPLVVLAAFWFGTCVQPFGSVRTSTRETPFCLGPKTAFKTGALNRSAIPAGSSIANIRRHPKAYRRNNQSRQGGGIVVVVCLVKLLIERQAARLMVDRPCPFVALSLLSSRCFRMVCRLTTCFEISHVASNILVAGAGGTPFAERS